MTVSIWLEDSPFQDYRSSDTLPAYSDIVIIGAGISGCSTAFHLLSRLEDVVSVCILEARGVASGATGRNLGKLDPITSGSYGSRKARYGSSAALDIVAFELENYRALESWICGRGLERELDFRPGLKSVKAFQATDEWDKAKADYNEFLRDFEGKFGSDCCRVKIIEDKAKLKELLGMDSVFVGAIVSEPCATLNPARLVFSLVRECLQSSPKQRFNLHCQTRVQDVTWDERNACWEIRTDRRGSMKCRFLVDCRNGYGAETLPDSNLVTPVRGQIHQVVQHIASAPKPDLTLSCNSGFEYFYYRPADRTWLLGGGRDWVDGMERGISDDTAINPEIADRMTRHFLSSILYPQSHDNGTLLRCWTGIMGFSRDGMPWVGSMPGRSGYFMSRGFSGHGMPNAFLCARAVAGLISGQGDDGCLPEPYRITHERLASRSQNLISSFLLVLGLLILLSIATFLV